MFHLLFVIFPLLTVIDSVTAANRRREYTLTISYAQNSSSIVLINGQFPGPLLEAELDDILVIHVTNSLPTNEEVTIHFHGMLMRKTPHMDGMAYITQLPIPSGRQFIHVFHAYPAGTYFYHSHSGLQAVTAFGALLIHESRRPWKLPEVPSGPLFFSDQWQTSDRRTQEAGLLASPFKWAGEPTGLLINGQRNFVLTLQPKTKYLLRLIGATSLSTIVFAINQHLMTVIEVDGTVVKPKPKLSSIEIASGQRYAVIIETKNQRQGVFLMQAAIRWRAMPNSSSCTGVLRYGSISPVPPNLSTLARPPLLNEADLLALAWKNPYETTIPTDAMPRRSINREYFLLGTQGHTSDGLGIRWVINNATLDMPRLKDLTVPLLFDLYNGNKQNLPTDVTYSIEGNELIDIVIQNTVALNGVCETHPFHMHGHKFWVHSYGTGMYDKSVAPSASAVHPVLRDSLILHASEYAYFTLNRTTRNYLKPCGWTKLRMIANNPGLWMLHCHIGSHALMGMSILIEESIKKLELNSLPQQ